MPRKKIQTGYTAGSDAIPDSKVFGGSAEADEAFNSRPIMDCHVGGVLVRDMPLLTQRCIHMDQTDEGFAAKNAGRVDRISVDAPREDRRFVRDAEGGRFENVTRQTDSLGKKLDQFREDMTDRDMDSYHARNPLQELIDKHVPAGMKPKLLSPDSTEIGNGYEICKDAKGDPVKLRNMVLGVTSERRAAAKNARARAIGQARLDQMKAKQVQEHGGDPMVADQR